MPEKRAAASAKTQKYVNFYETTQKDNALYAVWKENTPITTYIVIHNGGVDIFKDEVYGGLLSGTRTPPFQGSLARRGYVFAGWTPVVSRCVTGNATYTATWKKVPDNYRDTTVIEIGGGNSSSSPKEENPNTGAPVFVGVSVGALAAAK